jgi:hypothetical protein
MAAAALLHTFHRDRVSNLERSREERFFRQGDRGFSAGEKRDCLDASLGI